MNELLIGDLVPGQSGQIFRSKSYFFVFVLAVIFIYLSVKAQATII